MAKKKHITSLGRLMNEVEEAVLRFDRAMTGFIKFLELKNGWAEDVPKLVRFILLILFSFFTYGIFKALGSLEIAQINAILENVFKDPGFFIIGLYTLFWSVVGVYSSILTASLFNSLAPKP